MDRFSDQKYGFRQLFRDRNLFPKVMLGGFLLINPFLVALAPSYFSGTGPDLVKVLFPIVLIFNVFSFWFPLGFTFEVLRRARFSRGSQLPDWKWDLLPRYGYEGAIKFIIAIPTIIAPVLLWVGLLWLIFIHELGLPLGLIGMFLPPIFLIVIPFCGIACCRWLDGDPVWDCAFNYVANLRQLIMGWKDYFIAAAFIIGVNSITTAFFYTIPFGAVFGLCLVDTWFGPIHAQLNRHRVIPAAQTSRPNPKKDQREKERAKAR